MPKDLTGKFKVVPIGKPQYQIEKIIYDTSKAGFICPECGARLTATAGNVHFCSACETEVILQEV